MQDSVRSPSLLPTFLALLASAVTVGGSLYLSMGMDLLACPLCFYQRTFAFGVLGILLVGLLTKARTTGYLNLLALVPAVAGSGVAGFHTYLDGSGILVCPKGVFGVGTAPQQSLAALGVTTLLLMIGLWSDIRRKGVSAVSVVFAIVVGAVFTVGSIKSSPKPSKPKPELMDRMCYPVD